MGRIVSLVLGLGLSCLLVTGLLRLTEGFAQKVYMGAPAVNPSLRAETGLWEDAQILLPAPVPGTSLIAERLVNYEGPFIEDGSDMPVSHVTALVIHNAGERVVEEATVVLERAGERYEFQLTYLLPGMSVMALEQSAAPFVRDGITQISGWERLMEESSLLLSGLELTSLDMGSLSVTNLTEEALRNITLYHKNYLPEGIYVGGITYETSISSLEPGQTVQINPEHYADGYSKIFYAQ